MMKYFKSLLVILAASIFLFSCSKEASRENPVNGNGGKSQWKFKEGSTLFNGPIDTAYVQTAGSLTNLMIEGHSSDKRDRIMLQVFAVNLETGVFKTPICNFTYFRDNIILYQNNLGILDSFSIEITRLDSSVVEGTFTGLALSIAAGATTTKLITDGYFSAKLKSDADTTTPPPTGDYFPTTTNSNWSYDVTNGDTLLTKSTELTKQFSGNQYNVFSLDYGIGNDQDTSYYRKDGKGAYYEYFTEATNPFAQVLTNPKAFENTMLKDNVAVNSSWESSTSGSSLAGITVTCKLKSTLIQKAASVSVGGKTYKDVLKVKEEYQAGPSAGPFQNLLLMEVWYAKGIGIVKIVTNNPATGTQTQASEVRRSQIF